MKSLRARPVRVLAGFILAVGLLSIAPLLSCTGVDEKGHTYLKVNIDTTWYRFDSVQVYLDAGDGTDRQLLFHGSIDSPDDLHRLPAEDYDGGKVTLVLIGFKDGKAAEQETREYDGATRKTLNVVVKVLVDTSGAPGDTTKNPGDTTANPGKLEVELTPSDTTVSIRDSLVFSATARASAGRLSGYAWIQPVRAPERKEGDLDDTQADLSTGIRFPDSGTFTVRVVVFGKDGDSVQASVKVKVLLDRPQAFAGKDTTIATGTPVVLRGQGKDDLGRVMSQAWKIDGGPYQTSDDGEFEFPAQDSAGTHIAIFRVMDDDSLFAEDSVAIFVVSTGLPTLTELSVSHCEIKPSFQPDSLLYACRVPYGIPSVRITAKAQGNLLLNGMALQSGQPSDSIAVGQDPVSVSLKVSLNDKDKTYGITLIPGAPSSNHALSGLTVSKGSLSPAFAASKLAYADTVSFADSTFTLTATAQDTTAKLTLNGGPLASGAASPAQKLAVGMNVFTLVVTAQNGDSSLYRLTVKRKAGNASLKSLAVSTGSFTPAFSSQTTVYTMQVPYTTTSITLVAIPQDSLLAAMTLNGASLASNQASSPIALPVATTTATLVVTAEDTAQKRTYTLTITRNAEATPGTPALSSQFLLTPDRPTWKWKSGGGGNGTFRYKFDDSTLTTGSTTTTDSTFSPAADLSPGSHTLFLQERNTSGAWSPTAKNTVVISDLKIVGDYPLAGHAADTTSMQSDLNLTGAPFLCQGVYVNGVYINSSDPGPSDVHTPTLTGFDSTNFTMEVDFKSDSMGTLTRPVIVGGSTYRWLGVTLDPDGKLSLLHNNSTQVKGTLNYATNVWQTAKITYSAGIARLYLNDVLSASATTALAFGSRFDFTSNNTSNGSNFKGNLRNLRVYAGTNKIAHYPFCGDTADISHKQTQATLKNAPYQAAQAGVTLTGVYSRSEAYTSPLKNFDLGDFSIRANFNIAAAPAANMPVIVGGQGYRWLGAIIDPSGKLNLLYNNSLSFVTDAKVSYGVNHEVRIRYSSARKLAALYLDDVLAGSQPIDSLDTGDEKVVTTSNYSTGTGFKGTLIRLRIFSK